MEKIGAGRLWTIEVNLDKDPADGGAWHVDALSKTIETNVEHCVKGAKHSRWTIVGIKNNLTDATEYCKKLQEKIVEKRATLK